MAHDMLRRSYRGVVTITAARHDVAGLVAKRAHANRPRRRKPFKHFNKGLPFLTGKSVGQGARWVSSC